MVLFKVGRSLRAAAVVRRWPTTTRPEAKEWISFPTTLLLPSGRLRFGKISCNLALETEIDVLIDLRAAKPSWHHRSTSETSEKKRQMLFDDGMGRCRWNKEGRLGLNKKRETNNTSVHGEFSVHM